MGSEFHFRDKITVAVLGATGSIGQRFVEMLSRHPWFQIVALGASERSSGKKYGQAVKWLLPSLLSKHIAEMPIAECKPPFSANLIFSALDFSVAAEVEEAFANEGHFVITNAKNYRMQPDIPLLIPEVNSNHLELLDQQKFKGGKIIANPNCCAVGLSLALKPLDDLFGVEAVHVTTMQAISGAGYPGVSAYDIQDNIIPYIEDEEEKLETEPQKILGKLEGKKIFYTPIKISAQCNRVPITDGHTQSVSIKFKNKPSKKEIIEAWNTFSAEPQKLSLASAPEKPIYYFDSHDLPQPKLHRDIDKGMAISVGGLRDCPLFDYKFHLVSHNTIRGGAGGAILCAELLVRKGFIFW